MTRKRSWSSHVSVLAMGVAVVGVLLSAAGAWTLHRSIESQAQGEFDRLVRRVEYEVGRRFKLPM